MSGRWFLTPVGLVGVPPKNGGTSFYRAMFDLPYPTPKVRKAAIKAAQERGQGPFTVYQVADMEGRKILAMRDPVSRFASLWRDKCRDRADGSGGSVKRIRGLTPDQLLAVIRKDPYGNAHWTPQCHWMVDGAEVIDYRQLPKLLGYEVQSNATAVRHDDPPMPEDAIRELYAYDCKLWGQR